ncbi:hypothetical protein C8R41DRAFT_834925 [Lentinula lateritia]|uniref:Uncharacterized protein n=1 Tax=Lentinula lateritia TaxID=40482 RepID=A0ABQ8VDE5_9AGAR|nr:hypothetical protein C8R41DRAFT_834925 [Lentinula lateritia]
MTYYSGVAYVLLHVDQYIYIGTYLPFMRELYFSIIFFLLNRRSKIAVPSSAVFLVAVSVILRIACAFSAATTGWPSLAMERHGQP